MHHDAALKPALCSAAEAAARNLAAGAHTHHCSNYGSRSKLDWAGVIELCIYLPFILLRLPHQRVGSQLDRILASPTNGSAPVSRKEGGSYLSAADTTTQQDKTTGVPVIPTTRNRFARSFSQLVASQLVGGDLVAMAKSQGILTNMGVDYVVVFRFATTGKLDCTWYRRSMR